MIDQLPLVDLTSRNVSFPRRQQLRRLRRAALLGLGACAAFGLALTAAASQALSAAAVLFVVGAVLGVSARDQARLAARNGVGARSEAEVQRALQVLEREGWRLRSSLPWQGRGDVDHVAIAPTGVAFAIETKTRSYQRAHLASVRAQAVWLERRRRRWCPRGARPVLCVTRGPQLEQIADGVLVVSVNRLAATLRAGAGTVPRPEFLAPA